jgi:DNA polymerase-3 subunit epsilon
VQSYLVRLPENAEIPPAVQRVTGISEAVLEKSRPAADIWRKVAATAHRIAAANRMALCPTLIHYARYEEPFLRNLHTAYGSVEAFPLQIICTHEITRRLLPGLPRKGLRAVAGYFGHAVPQHRRSAAHAVATAVIWQNLVQALGAQYNIENLDQLTHWLSHTFPASRPARVYPMKREWRLDIPENPGIYRMRRANGDLLYIGKATSLKSRVNSYFRPKAAQAEHILEMLSQAAGLDVTLTGSALEAAILESDEIKREAPPYNIALQKGRRKLVFCSRDLRQSAFNADKTRCIGPLPEGNITAALTAFGAWHKGSQIEAGDDWARIGYAISGLPEAYAPPPECMALGLDLFRRRHWVNLRRADPLRSLTRIGFTLWRQRLAALQEAQSEGLDEADGDDKSPAEALESEKEPAWTPESVAGVFEAFAMRSALLIRRARWLCLLSESTLAWEAREPENKDKFVLMLKNGAVCQREQLPIAQKTPPPPGYRKRMAKRQKNFDLATYERLRVLTTELRRLVAEGRKIEIRLRPKLNLDNRKIAKILPWV